MGPGQQTAWLEADAPRRRAAERIRAAFLSTLKPDLLLVASIFEGFGDDAVTTFPPDVNGPPTISVCYDLIPLLRPDTYLADPAMRRKFYYRALLELATQHRAAVDQCLEPGGDRGRAGHPGGAGRPTSWPASDPHVPSRWPRVTSRRPPSSPGYGLHGGYVLCRGRRRATQEPGRADQAPIALHAPGAAPVAPAGGDGAGTIAELVPPLRRAMAEAGLAA